MEKIIKQFVGFSGSKVLLMQNDDLKFVRKITNIQRNVEQLQILQKHNFPVPKIYKYSADVLDMEYIEGLDMKTYITNYGVCALQNFLELFMQKTSACSAEKDYTSIYKNKLCWIDDFKDLPFNKDILIKKLPKKLPCSLYHGDLTLQNIIFSKNNSFYLIDPLTTEYDSWVFDFCKLRQDLTCGWFIRDRRENNLQTYLKILENYFLSKSDIISDNYLLILNLLRILPYSVENSKDYNFLIGEVYKLWK